MLWNIKSTQIKKKAPGLANLNDELEIIQGFVGRGSNLISNREYSPTSCLTGLDSEALLFWKYQQIYLLAWIHNSKTGGQLSLIPKYYYNRAKSWFEYVICYDSFPIKYKSDEVFITCNKINLFKRGLTGHQFDQNLFTQTKKMF